MPLTVGLGRLKKKDSEFQASLGYVGDSLSECGKKREGEGRGEEKGKM